MFRTWSMMEVGSACSATVGVAAVVEAASRSSRKDCGAVRLWLVAEARAYLDLGAQSLQLLHGGLGLARLSLHGSACSTVMLRADRIVLGQREVAQAAA